MHLCTYIFIFEFLYTSFHLSIFLISLNVCFFCLCISCAWLSLKNRLFHQLVAEYVDARAGSVWYGQHHQHRIFIISSHHVLYTTIIITIQLVAEYVDARAGSVWWSEPPSLYHYSIIISSPLYHYIFIVSSPYNHYRYYYHITIITTIKLVAEYVVARAGSDVMVWGHYLHRY